MKKINCVNQEYYEELYYQGNVFWRWLHCQLSFDQQSKKNPNRYAIAPLLEAILKKTGRVRVLDYGCGWGLFLQGLPKRQAEAFCYDISENAMSGLEAVMRMFGREVKTISFGEDGRIIPDDFDIIICSHVLEHVEDDAALISKLLAALRPGGYLLANVPINEVRQDPKHARSYNPESLRKLMEESGLKIAKEIQVCKWSALLGPPENFRRPSKINEGILRVVRGIVSLIPYRLILWSERAFLSSKPYQQLIMLGKK